MGLGGLEPPTLRLSGVRSNHLSYRPVRPRSAIQASNRQTLQKFKERAFALSKPDSKPKFRARN